LLLSGVHGSASARIRHRACIRCTGGDRAYVCRTPESRAGGGCSDSSSTGMGEHGGGAVR
jgi:hypothetical protein